MTCSELVGGAACFLGARAQRLGDLEAVEALSDEQYVRNVVDLLFRSARA